MRIIFFCLFNLLFGNAISQTTFYVRPIIENKIFIGNISYGVFDPIIIQNKPFDNPYISVRNNKYFTAPVFNLGINLGVNFSDKHLLELMFGTDAAGNRLDMRFLVLGGSSLPQVDEGYVQSRAYRSGGINYYRMGVNYHYRITHNFQKSNLGISTGAGLLFNPNVEFAKGPYSIITDWYSYLDGNPATLIDNVRFESIETKQYAVGRWGSFMCLGVYADLWMFKTYLFSMNLYYLQSFKIMEITDYELIFDDNGVINSFKYTSNSRGSGFYLQLSRRFNVWKPGSNLPRADRYSEFK